MNSSNEFIYIGYNSANGKKYVGQTRNGHSRWHEHLRGCGNAPFARAIRKYGRQSFRFAVLEYCSADELIDRENFWISLICPEYNQVLFLETRGRYYAEETRRKISKAASNRAASEETRNAISEQSRSRWCDPEYRKRLSKAQTSAWSDERRKAASESRKGKPRDPDVMEKCRLSHVGRKRSPETCAKISAAKKNPSPETRSKIASAMRAAWKRRQEEFANVEQLSTTDCG